MVLIFQWMVSDIIGDQIFITPVKGLSSLLTHIPTLPQSLLNHTSRLSAMSDPYPMSKQHDAPVQYSSNAKRVTRSPLRNSKEKFVSHVNRILKKGKGREYQKHN
jgi:hypothetical protein